MPRVMQPIGDMLGRRALVPSHPASFLPSQCHLGLPLALSGLKVWQEALFHRNCHTFFPGWVGTEPGCLAGIALHGLAGLCSRASGETQAQVPRAPHHTDVPAALCRSQEKALLLPPQPQGVDFTLQDNTSGLTHWLSALLS